MKRICSLVVALTLCKVSYSQPVDSNSGGSAASSIPYATLQVIGKDDPSAVVVEKAAKVLPRPNQSAWMRMERTFFLHYGPNSFHNVEWGNGRENPSVFNPTAFDAEQWMRAIQDANGKMIVLVCKHHDGLCLWQTRYTNHSVAGSPWRGGKGDEVREVAEAAKKYGVRLGVYLSPADLYQLRTNPTNRRPYYGNGSPKLRSTIPTDPASFQTDPSKGRTPPEGFKSYTYEVDDYNRYFLNQLYELLTDYGPVDEVWFDGANPDRSVPETYDYAAWYNLISSLRPNAVIACKAPDVRWVGNESGVGRTTEWSVIPLPKPPETNAWLDQGQPDLGSRAKLVPGSHLWWYPAEVNQPILYGWFWGPGKGVRPAADLVNTYYQSVGRNGVWLLNLSPDNRGLIPDNQLASLHLSSQVIRETFAKNLAAGGTLTADSSNPANGPALALDGNLDTWWEAAPGKTSAVLTLNLEAKVTFDVVSMQEAVDHRGQRIESFSFDTWDGSKWKTADTLEERTTVGYKRLSRLRSPATTNRVRIRIDKSRLEPTLAEIGLFKQAELLQPPAISERDPAGAVTLSNPKNLTMVYTTDASVPTKESPVYRSPISLPGGGTVNAACVDAGGRLGMMASKRFWGYVPTGWKVIAVDNREPTEADNAARAIDGDPSTVWQSSDSPLPHSLTVDVGSLRQIGGLCYIPPRGGARGGARGRRGGGGGPGGGVPAQRVGGAIDSYRFETSGDGKNWTTNVEQGRFGNIRNNPVPQEVRFAPVTARFFRFTALSEASGNNRVSVAELTVLTVNPEDDKK